jgi:hypothetical protein
MSSPWGEQTPANSPKLFKYTVLTESIITRVDRAFNTNRSELKITPILVAHRGERNKGKKKMANIFFRFI